MKIKLRPVSRFLMPVIAFTAGLITNANAQYKNSSGDDDKLLDPWYGIFEPVEPGDFRESDDFRFLPKERLSEIDSALNRQLLKTLEDLVTSEGDLLDSAFDFLLEEKSPQDIQLEIETRIERLIDRIRDNYSINSGQNDRLDRAINHVSDPFFSSLDDFVEQTKRFADGVGGIPDPLAPDPRVALQSRNPHLARVESFAWRYLGMSQGAAANNVSLYGIMREIKRRSLNSLYQMKRDLEVLEQDTPESKQEVMGAIDQLIGEEEELLDLVDAAFKAAKEAFEMIFGVPFDAPSTTSPTAPDQMPSPDDPGFSEEGFMEVIEFLLRNHGDLSFLEKGSHFYGLVMPAPDQREIPNPEDVDRNAGRMPLDPFVNPGAEPVVDPENPEDIPEGLQGPPEIQKFGGVVDPVGPRATKSKDSESTANFFTKKHDN